MSEHTPLTEAERIERVLQIELNRCWTCHKPRVSEDDWDRYVHPGEGEHLCWEVAPYTCTYPCDVPLETHIAERILAARTSTATADDGLRERVEALADDPAALRRVADALYPNETEIAYRPNDIRLRTARTAIRAALDATAAPTTDTGARDE